MQIQEKSDPLFWEFLSVEHQLRICVLFQVEQEKSDVRILPKSVHVDDNNNKS